MKHTTSVLNISLLGWREQIIFLGIKLHQLCPTRADPVSSVRGRLALSSKMSQAAWLRLTKCPRPPGSILQNVRGRLAPSSKTSEAAWLRPPKCPRPPGSVLNLKLPCFHGNRLEFQNSDFARLLSGLRTFTMPSLITIGQESREELAHKHFQCPRLPGSVFSQIIVRL